MNRLTARFPGAALVAIALYGNGIGGLPVAGQERPERLAGR
jgi:hypothetical protein